MRRFSTGGTYVNFLTEEEGGGADRRRVRRELRAPVGIKAKWDPDNLFRMNKNIAPPGREPAGRFRRARAASADLVRATRRGTRGAFA